MSLFERNLITTLPEGVELVEVAIDDPCYDISRRANELFVKFCAEATTDEVVQANNAILGFRSDFSCGKAVRVNINNRWTYEAYDADEKTLEYLLARQG